MELLHEYRNGNYNVKLYEDGTKVRFTKDKDFKSSFPETIDMKITNYCDMNCKFCYENSNTEGKHAKLHQIFDNLFGLPAGVELALGGGNPLDHPGLVTLCAKLKHKGFVPNITVNSMHLKDVIHFITLRELIEAELVYGVGISYNGERKNPLHKYSDNVVCHLIAGIHSFQDIKNALKIYGKVLILGYKNLGRGDTYFKDHTMKVVNNLNEIKKELPEFIQVCSGGVISFDNLAITQLDVEMAMDDHDFKLFYMGNDGNFSMYYDAVENTFAKSSISQEKRSADHISLINYFQGIGEKK